MSPSVAALRRLVAFAPPAPLYASRPALHALGAHRRTHTTRGPSSLPAPPPVSPPLPPPLRAALRPAKPEPHSRSRSSRIRTLSTQRKGALSQHAVVTPTINWYPGHIAKAERVLQDSLKLVDVVIEVRDLRIPISTAHPSVPKWLGSRAHILAMNRVDLAPPAARAAWRRHLLECGSRARFINAKLGRGVSELKKLAVEAGAGVNEKRKRRGLLPRPVRCLVIGYPNVGKSALINRLVGRSSAKSANKPGVTRNFQWVRISDTIELLDMPGIIPAKFVSQDTALRLAICDDIGQAAYDHEIIAALMVEELKRVSARFPDYFNFETMKQRFKVDPMEVSGEEFLHRAAEKLSKGDIQRTAVRLLTEFRAGMLGPAALEAPEMLGDIGDDVTMRKNDPDS